NIDDIFLKDWVNETQLPFFVVSNDNNQFKNQIRLTDPNGLMGLRGATIAFIKMPTFYQKIDGKTEAESVYETAVPLVKQQADKIYQQFRDGLEPAMKLIYPSEVTLKMDYPSSISDPSQVANAEFSYDSKIGTLKYVVINYVDKTGNIVGSEALPGTIGSTIPLPKKLSLPRGYQLVNGQNIPISVTIEKVISKPRIIDIYVEKESKTPVIQTGFINYIDPDGKVVKTDQ
ncbi:hypothetical protein, partial [Limosilactobacillus fermentum]|uniref:hypothetical protein n=1 Tax=Limosilactobacillus fermentum TaxID=1613 RepID=UPI00301B79E6